jgi:RES domain-containing protein
MERIPDRRPKREIPDLRRERIRNQSGPLEHALKPMIYTAEHYSTALFERLVHGSGSLPPNQHWIEITLPPNLSYETFNIHAANSRGWDDPVPGVSQPSGEAWHRNCRSLLLMVPSVVVRFANNILINPSHTEFQLITSQSQIRHHQPVYWDPRFSVTPSPPSGNAHPAGDAGSR